jgi:uncharacterized protein with GYD domain
MAKYVSLGRFRKEIDFGQAKERVEKVKQALAAVGGKLESLHYTMGAYDYVVLIDLPDNAAAAAFWAWYGRLGVAETTTMPCFSIEEMQAAAGRIK